MNRWLIVALVVMSTQSMAGDLTMRGGLGFVQNWEGYGTYEGAHAAVLAFAYEHPILGTRFVHLEGDLQYSHYEVSVAPALGEDLAASLHLDDSYAATSHIHRVQGLTGGVHAVFTPRARADRLQWRAWHEAGIGLAWGRDWIHPGQYQPETATRLTCPLFYRLNLRVTPISNAYVEGRWNTLLHSMHDHRGAYVQYVVQLGYRFRVG